VEAGTASPWGEGIVKNLRDWYVMCCVDPVSYDWSAEKRRTPETAYRIDYWMGQML
jgi:hypothetical protein